MLFCGPRDGGFVSSNGDAAVTLPLTKCPCLHAYISERAAKQRQCPLANLWFCLPSRCCCTNNTAF